MKLGYPCSLCRAVATHVEERLHKPTGRLVLICGECLSDMKGGERAFEFEITSRPPLIVRLPFRRRGEDE